MYLTCLAAYKITHPNLKYLRADNSGKGHSAFHPEDVSILKKFAIGWKSGIRAKVLIKHKGMCQLCGVDLIKEDYFEIHHKVPPSDPKFFSIKNIIPLCVDCHKVATAAKLSKDKTKFNELKQLGIFE